MLPKLHLLCLSPASIGPSNLHACMARPSSCRNFSIKVVLDHDYLLAAVGVSLEHPLNRCVGRLTLASSNVPPKETKCLSHRWESTYALRIISSK